MKLPIAKDPANVSISANIPGVAISMENGSKILNHLENDHVIVNNLLESGKLNLAYNINETLRGEEFGVDKWVSLHRIPTPQELYEKDPHIANWIGKLFCILERLRIHYWRPFTGYRGAIIYDYNKDTHMMFGSNRFWNAGTPLLPSIRTPCVPIFSVNGTIGKKWDNTTPSTRTRIDYYLNQTYTKDVTSYNIIGNISGKNQEKRAVIGNHYDSWWGQCSGDSAASNGILLGIAKYIIDNGLTPKYNINFIAFAGEEYGFRGSHFHSRYYRYDDIPYMFSLDQLAYDQSNPPVELELWPSTTDVKKVVWEITNQSNYENRTGHKVELMDIKRPAPSDETGMDLCDG